MKTVAVFFVLVCVVCNTYAWTAPSYHADDALIFAIDVDQISPRPELSQGHLSAWDDGQTSLTTEGLSTAPELQAAAVNGLDALRFREETKLHIKQEDMQIVTLFIVLNYDKEGSFPEGNPAILTVNGKKLLYGKSGSTYLETEFNPDTTNIFMFGEQRIEGYGPYKPTGERRSFGSLRAVKVITVELTDTLETDEIVIGGDYEGIVAHISAYSRKLTYAERVVEECALARRYYMPEKNGTKISVDFAQADDVNSMSGYLHGNDGTTPHDSLILPTRPAHWRYGVRWRKVDSEEADSSNPASLIKQTAYVPEQLKGQVWEHALISGLWGGPTHPGVDSIPWGNAPYNNKEKWYERVRFVARAKNGPFVIHDVWNEPDWKAFFKGTRQQLFETYEVAYKAIRDELGPDALVGGPCIHIYKKDYIIEFLDYCLEKDLEVNVLIWHELHVFPRNTEWHMQDIRENVLENPKYDPLNIKMVVINEIGSWQDQYRPGDYLAFFHYLEQGGADGACKACWYDRYKNSNCANNTLNALLMPETYKKRALWWAYKYYADGVDKRVYSHSNNPEVVSLATSRSLEGYPAVLLGYWDWARPEYTEEVELKLQNINKLEGFEDADRVKLIVEELPDTKDIALAQPIQRAEMVVDVEEGTAIARLLPMTLHGAFYVKVVQAD